jgi:hypothetical protein
MPEISPNLALPYLLAAQAQKHVTINEGPRPSEVTLLRFVSAILVAVKKAGLSTSKPTSTENP